MSSEIVVNVDLKNSDLPKRCFESEQQLSALRKLLTEKVKMRMSR